MPDFKIEKELSCIVAGVDEAGRGPLCGPVVAAAVILDTKKIPRGLDDSKKLDATKREKLFIKITGSSIYGIGIIWQDVIDKVNILQATKIAMSEAVKNLTSRPEKIIVDGNQKFHADGITVIPVVDGDAKSRSIAAASIIAKVTRDKIMSELHEEYPHYGWKKNAGYATKEHLQAIGKYGICEYHRKSFAPVRTQEVIEQNQLSLLDDTFIRLAS